MRSLFVILICLAGIGCQVTKRVHNETEYLGPAFLRVHNASNVDFLDVIFQGNRFGNITSGQLTQYQAAAPWSSAKGITVLPGDVPQQEISLRLVGHTNRICYIGVCGPISRKVYCPGNFTCVLKLVGDGKHLDIETIKDE